MKTLKMPFDHFQNGDNTAFDKALEMPLREYQNDVRRAENKGIEAGFERVLSILCKIKDDPNFDGSGVSNSLAPDLKAKFDSLKDFILENKSKAPLKVVENPKKEEKKKG